MRERWNPGRVAVLLLCLLPLGCEPGGPSSTLAPTSPEIARSMSDDGSYQLVQGGIPTGELRASQLIDSGGGEVHLAGHALLVPEGAVEEPTLFSMAVVPGAYVEVELVALVGDVNVGESGFADGRVVTLSLSYASATGLDDPERLTIVHRRDDGQLEPLVSAVDRRARTVTTGLRHFSRYCLATD